ncbi:MAG: AAA domain-containing protein [Helicobacter trogontum]|uniref:AAA domain-containing protein n=1 Tax=Helicobacter trogontum TaxID=50960 RepID=UPI00243274A5|nr:AAA domain-containing protein [Helicobacter trogontum]MCI5786123.1 AAA domain-containing protein [Helicobacter trogontum]
MKFNMIETDRTFIKQVEINNDKVKKESLGILLSVDSMEIDGIDEIIVFKYTDTYNEIELEFKRSSNAIIKVLEVKDKRATIKIIIFAMPLNYIYEKLYIKLDDKLLDKRLKESDFLITINTKSYIAITSGNNVEDKLFLSEAQKIQNEIKKLQKKIQENPDNKAELEQKIQQLEKDRQNIQIDEIAFTMLSDSKHLAIKRVNIDNDKVLYKATKLMEKTQKEMAGLRLVKLKEPFEFKDNSVRANIKDMLENGNLASTYLDIWDKYATKEGDFLLQKARDIGEIEIKEVDRFKLIVEIDLRDKLNENDFICIMENTPPYLVNKEIDFKTYMQENITQEKLKKENKLDVIKTYKIEKITSESIELEKQENMNLDDLKGKKFSLSIFGDFVALKRKYKARQRMLEGKSANPILPMIFASEVSENLKQILNEQKKNAYPPLSDNVEKKIFKTKPTENQVEAIRMAINTKDIAIIHGPPGTGKTTVINAIIERLNELMDGDLDKKGSIFIGGFQHTAVENLIQRMNLNGIPTPKYGKKTNEIDSLNNYDYIMEWGEKIANNIVIKEDSESVKEFRELAVSYCKRPSQSKQKEILQKIIDTKEPKLKECRDIARYLLDMNDTNKMDDDLSVIYAIRSNELSFQDDGIDRNCDLLKSEFRELLTDKEKKILENKIFCQDLIKLKDDLIKRFTSKPKFEKEKPNSEVLDLIEKVINVFNNLSIESRINVVLAEFKQKLQSNPFALKNMLKDYSIAFSATIGQSSSKEILDAKGIKESDTQQYEAYSYDTVIIDEAAMVSPLDLFLVLVLAKHRIILVGDHRQLPHRVNEEVLEKMENDATEGDNIESELLKESIFGVLKIRAQELQKIDGVKRFITLNKQFRTHPLLGNLVSKIFYEQHDKKEGYESARLEKDFSHKLKGIEDIPAVWINLSKDMEIDSKNGTSRMRKCEIDMIESKLVEYLSSESGAELSYGIISFYRAQTDAIKDRIEKLKQDSKFIAIKEALEKVKIGSVDQFQGSEFDIVFLSTVRSGNTNNISPQKAFGFLAVPNRLCVAMSRQKKCLIAVGDMAYFKSDLAKQYVRGMYEFASRCETKGCVL